VNLCSAQVLLCKNYVDAARQLVNGSRGIVTEFRGAAGPQGEPLPVVRFLDGGEQLIKKEAFTVESDGKVLASRTQLPLILAWAMTVHKTQGMSLDSMVLHLDGAFEYGQVYVGLSRARSLTGLEVRGFRPDLVKAHPKALQFYSTVLHTQPAQSSQPIATPSSVRVLDLTYFVLVLCVGDLPRPPTASSGASASDRAGAVDGGHGGGGGGGGGGGDGGAASSLSQSTIARRIPPTIGNGVFVADSKLLYAGRGLFADKDFCKNDLITEYGGEVIDADEAKRRRAKGAASHIRSLVPLHVCIDGRHVSVRQGEGGASFINDPLGKHPYNCKFVVKQTSEGVVRTGLSVGERCFVVALSNIRKGDELYVSYGNDYWVDVFTNKR
jgi:hypothetical protein